MARIRTMFLSGLDGWADDDLALVRPWGFDLGRITVPVSVWFGGRDTRVDRAHADWLLAHVPAAQGHEPGDADFGRVLAWIAMPAACGSAAPPTAAPPRARSSGRLLRAMPPMMAAPPTAWASPAGSPNRTMPATAPTSGSML
jgi:hypothetical protein